MDIKVILAIAAIALCLYIVSRTQSTTSIEDKTELIPMPNYPERINLIYKAGEYMANIQLGESKNILVVVDTGSNELVVSNNKCKNCPDDYGVYQENIDTPINQKIRYVSQTTEYSVLREPLKLGNHTFNNYEFGSVDSMESNGKYGKYNVFGLSPLSDIWEHMSTPKILSFNFKDNYMQFNKLLNNNKSIPLLESTPSLPYFMIQCKLNNQMIKVVVDTGFTKTVLPSHFEKEKSYVLEFDNGTKIEMVNDSTSCTFNNLFGGCVVLGNKWLINKCFDFDVQNRLFYID